MSRSNQNWTLIASVALIALAFVVAGQAGRQLEQSIGDGHGMGYVPNPAGVREFLSELDEPMFRQAGAECIAKAQGKDTYLFRYVDAAHKEVYGRPFSPWNQGAHGSCVSFGWALGSYFAQSVDWATGKMPKPPKLVATEPIYGGSRTAARLPPVKFAGYSDGSYGAAAARWVAGLKSGVGGIVYREKYGQFDLSEYSIPRSKEWGANGCPEVIGQAGMKHTARAVALCEDWPSLVAALEAGYVVPICSNVGFAKTTVRDADGFLPRGSQWNHCMLLASVKYAANSGKNGEPPMQNPRDGVLCINSWGKAWVGGPKHPADQPDGSFWMTRADAEAILRQSDSFVIGGVSGFEWRDLHHGGWLQREPVERKQPVPPSIQALAL
jgi:hypothetical protein